MTDQINQLRDRILSKKLGSKSTELTGIFQIVREFGCFGEIMGREFEVRDKSGNLVYTIVQKPITCYQLQIIADEFNLIKHIDNEIEQKKYGTKKSMRGR